MNYPSIVIEALAEQEREYASDFQTRNSALRELLETLPPADLLDIGRSLLSASEPSHRILGTRVIREQSVAGEPASRETALGLVLKAMLDEKDDEVLLWLVAAVSFLGEPEALPKLEALASHPSASIRDRVASAIAACLPDEVPESALATLLDLSTDLDSEVRFSAVFELGVWWQRGVVDSRIGDALVRSLEDSDHRIRMSSSEALEGRLA